MSSASPSACTPASSSTRTASVVGDAQLVAADDADHRRGGAERGERVARAGDDERARALAEQRAPRRAVERHLGAEPARDAALGQRDREPALGDVVRRAQRARAHGLADRRRAACAARRGRRPGSSPSSASPRSLASSEPMSDGAQPRAAISATASPALREAEPARARGVRQLADHADDRRRVDRAAAALVVERDVAADDRHAERAAGVGEAGARRA